MNTFEKQAQAEIDQLERRVRHAQKEIRKIRALMPGLFVAPVELELAPGGTENVYFTDGAGNTYFYKVFL